MTILLERKYGRKENQLLVFLYLKKVERGVFKEERPNKKNKFTCTLPLIFF
ncbi:hypothetical protein IGI65_000384 [Enterococcus sp. DIV0755b]